MSTVQGLAADSVRNMVDGAINLVIVFTPLMLLETVLPRGPRPSLNSRLKAGVFWVVWLVMGTLAMLPVQLGIAKLGIAPLLPTLAPDFLPGQSSAIVGAVLAALVGDFFQYWSHRGLHQVPFLWRFHSMHHSVRDLHAAGGYHHFSELIIGAFIYGIPLSLLTRDPYAIPFLVFLLGVQGNYLHTATKLHFGPFNRILVDNRFHRIHHSTDPVHFSKNYCNFSPVWDWLFGTAYFPQRDEWPDTGLADQPEPDSIVEFLAQPFSTKRPEIPAPVTAR